ncbi:MAG TPA: hypothetical protein VFU38_03725 [Candidatus Krumholzibacteria bacterium]|nr:hypothetical protein [Candidatus Krumholzibacteria bacterium]
MLSRIALRLIVVMMALGYAGTALGQDKVHSYFNDTAIKVKATESPAQKREILTKNLDDMIKAIDTVKGAALTSEQDDVKLDHVKMTLQEKRDELAGLNGFDRVPDDQLNAFSTYIVQDMEQADRTITISLVVALLIIIIIILIA